MRNASDRSWRVFPAGSNGEFNLPRELSPVIARGQGCRLWDVADREYLDFSLGWGSVLVGHAQADVVAAVQARAPLGSNFSYTSDDSLALAEELVRLSPACEQVRFCASGTEATMYCQRLARAATGRSLILKFEGAYHGANEAGVTSLFPSAPADYPRPQPTSSGIDEIAAHSLLVAPFNDLEFVERLLAKRAGDLAAVIVEPLQRCVPPVPGFLAGLRELTQRQGVLLLFDEVVTGFRLAYGGAQEYYGVLPDLVAYGKALGGGYPIGAFGGRADLMQLVAEHRLGHGTYVWTASTLGGNPISSAAARAALYCLAQPGVYPRLHALGAALRGGMRAALDARGIPAEILGDGPLAQFVLTTNVVRDYRSSRHRWPQVASAVTLELFRRGIFLNPMGTKLYISLAHSEAELDQFLARFGQVLDDLQVARLVQSEPALAPVAARE